MVALANAARASQADRIPGVIDVSQQVVLKGNVNGKAQPQFDQGTVPPDTQLNYITLLVKLSPGQQTELQNLLVQQQDPSSPNYHRWLSSAQYAERFGLSRNDIAKISNWLQGQGFKIVRVANGRNWIAFRGTAAQVQSAFHTSIHRYQVDGETHIANATDPSVPKALDGIVLGFHGLDNFLWKPMNVGRNVVVNPDFSTGGSNFLAPDDIATIYDIKPLYSANYDGTGQNLVIVGQTDISTTDITQFRSGFNLPAINLQQIVATSLGCTDPGITGDQVEADLDLEWSGAVARNAKIIFVKCDVNHGGVFTSAQYAIDNNLAPVISMSYGGCEPLNGQSTTLQIQTIIQQANSEGITFLASSGDSGAAGCDASGSQKATQGLAVNIPASIPEVTGVGGSEFNEGGNNSAYWGSNGANFGSALSYIPEMGWNDTPLGFGIAATGGGKSIFFSKPSWQVGPGVPIDGARDVPDVALTASADHDGYLLCSSGSCAGGVQHDTFIVGGTSASTPVFAGILTLLNQYLVKNGFQGTPGLANINFTLYQFVQSNPSAFHDITAGNNIVPCSGTGCPGSGQYGYSAGVGYDQVTGVGSVDAFNFVTGWHGVGKTAATTAVTVSPTSVIAGASTSVTLTATVAGSGGTPTGTVTLFNGSTKITSVTLSNGTGTYSYNTTSLPGGTDKITGTYSGDATFAGSNSPPAQLDVQDFKLAVTPAAVAITAPGQSGITTLTVTPLGGFSQTINFSCAGLPAESNCSFSVVSSTIVTLTITTTAASRLDRPLLRGQQWFYAMVLPGFFGFLVPTVRRKPSRRVIGLVLLLTVVAVTMLWMVGCGGGSGGGGTNAGTPTGTSNVTVTGTAGTLTHPVSLTLTIN
jgi:subtilase family serine protease